MKKLLTISFAFVALATSAQANAFDLGSMAKSIPGGSCISQATTLIKLGGDKSLELYTAVSNGGKVTTGDFGASDETISKITAYVATGCAKDHLEKALGAALTIAQ